MRTTVLIVLTACVGAVPGVAAQTAEADALQTEEARVVATEDEYVEAEVNRDEATLRRIVDDRFVFNMSNGTTSDKDALIQSVMGMNMVGQTISERSLLIEGDIAFVFGTAALQFPQSDGGVSVSRLRYTTAYVKRDGEWRMLTLQMQKRAE